MEKGLKIIKLDETNLKSEHICCAMSDKKCQNGVNLKKEWIKNQFRDGFVFKKLNVSGKVFIEYIPAENAWSPVTAPGYMFIDCFWVSGSYQGKGYGTALLNECLNDSKDKNGLVIISSSKKKPFLSDKKYLVKKGFEVCDTAPPYFELMVLKLKDASLPSFNDAAKKAVVSDDEGFTIYYSDGCPFTDYYIEEVKKAAEKKKISLRAVKVESREQARNLPCVFPIYSVFYNGKFIMHEILSGNRFEKLLSTMELV